MWLAGGGASDAQNALVIAIVGAGAVLLAALVAGTFQLLAARAQRQNNMIPENAQTLLFERTAVLQARADDSDDRDEAQDRRLDQLERALDIDNINWRHPND